MYLTHPHKNYGNSFLEVFSVLSSHCSANLQWTQNAALSKIFRNMSHTRSNHVCMVHFPALLFSSWLNIALSKVLCVCEGALPWCKYTFLAKYLVLFSEWATINIPKLEVECLFWSIKFTMDNSFNIKQAYHGFHVWFWYVLFFRSCIP